MTIKSFKATADQEHMMHRLHEKRSQHRHLRNLCADTEAEMKELTDIFNKVMKEGQRIEASILFAEKKDGKIRIREKVRLEAL